MSASVEPDGDNLKQEKLENIRVAYQAALALRTSRADELWSQFNAMAVVQSILVAASVTLSTTRGQNVGVAAVGVALLGCLISLVWLLMHLRGHFWISYYRDCAKEYEKQLEGVNTISAGLSKRGEAGRLTVTNGSKVVILSFALAHVILIASELI